MLWPLLVEYTEPGVPVAGHAPQGNMALFLTLFILTCVEVLIVKVAQSEREIEDLMTPHDPSYSAEDSDDDCKLQVSLETDSARRRKHKTLLVDELRSKGEAFFDVNWDQKQDVGGIDTPNSVRQRQRNVKPTCENADVQEDISPYQDDRTVSQTVEIREHIEKLVENLVGGSLDGVSVGKLSKHSSYLGMFSEHHDSLCQGLARLGFALHFSICNGNRSGPETPEAAHSALKSLIQEITMKAIKLPDLKEAMDSIQDEGKDSDFCNKSYEDVMATAILNKIIEKCQDLRRRKRAKKREVLKLGGKVVDKDDPVDGEEEFMYNSNWSDNSASEQLSLTIEELIEEITTYENSDDDETIQTPNNERAIPCLDTGKTLGSRFAAKYFDSEIEGCKDPAMLGEGHSWEENWLFQKKRLGPRGNAHHPVPVPMLVPNPSQDFRALIGGVNADDLSDMSDCSDSALEDVVLAEDVSRGDINDGPTCACVDNLENCDKEEALEKSIVLVSPTSSLSDSSCPSLSQKEREISVDYDCVEKIDVLPSDPPVPLPRRFGTDSEREPEDCLIEKERKMWHHPLKPNNSYSSENINKRNQGNRNEYFAMAYPAKGSFGFHSDSPTELLKESKHDAQYSRDYYVKASRCPTGDPNIRLTPINQSLESSVESTGERFSAVSGMNEMSDSGRAFRTGEDNEIRIISPNVKELTKKFSRCAEECATKLVLTSSSSNQGAIHLTTNRKEPLDSAQRCSDVDEPKDGTSKSTSSVSTSLINVSQYIHSNVQITDSNSNYENINLNDEGKLNDKERENSGSSECTKSPPVPMHKFTGREVHSLTARSISKEFRDELKNNTSRKSIPKIEIDLGRSSETDRTELGSSVDWQKSEIVSESSRTRSPTPPIDMHSKRKFWEDLISASSK